MDMYCLCNLCDLLGRLIKKEEDDERKLKLVPKQKCELEYSICGDSLVDPKGTIIITMYSYIQITRLVYN